MGLERKKFNLMLVSPDSELAISMVGISWLIRDPKIRSHKINPRMANFGEVVFILFRRFRIRNSEVDSYFLRSSIGDIYILKIRDFHGKLGW